MPSCSIASYTGASSPSLTPIPCRNTPIQASETISNCSLLEREAVELSGAPPSDMRISTARPGQLAQHLPLSISLSPSCCHPSLAHTQCSQHLPSYAIRGLSSVEASEHQRYAFRNARAQPARPYCSSCTAYRFFPLPPVFLRITLGFLAIRHVTLPLTIVANSRCLSQLKADV